MNNDEVKQNLKDTIGINSNKRTKIIDQLCEKNNKTNEISIECKPDNNQEKQNIVNKLKWGNDTQINIKLDYNEKNDMKDEKLVGKIITTDKKPVEGCKVYLYNDEDKVVEENTTNSQGEYFFYKLEENNLYYIEYYFNEIDKDQIDGFNGQNYIVVPERQYISNNKNDIEKNTAIIFNRDDISSGNGKDKNKFTYEVEKDMDTTSGTGEKQKIGMLAGTYSSSGAQSFIFEGSKLYAGVVIEKREQFNLEVESNMVAYKLVLQNGQVYKQWSKNENDKIPDISQIVIQDKERYGAEIYIEYEITVKNGSKSIDCDEFSILTGNNLKYNEKLNLLTVYNEYSDGRWKILSENEIKKHISLTGDYVKEEYLKLTDTDLKAGELKTYSIILSKIISDDCTYSNITELIEYKNEGSKDEYKGLSQTNVGRRNYSQSKDYKSGKKMIPGNYWKGEDNDFWGGIEKDTGISQSLFILPPTGK